MNNFGFYQWVELIKPGFFCLEDSFSPGLIEWDFDDISNFLVGLGLGIRDESKFSGVIIVKIFYLICHNLSPLRFNWLPATRATKGGHWVSAGCHPALIQAGKLYLNV
jgi:hypothetical protein